MDFEEIYNTGSATYTTMINRTQITTQFKNYTDAYDSSDPKILLKIIHTGRVANLCEMLAKDLGLSTEDTDIAWLIGMFHDIGRFEQVTRYGTFTDADSIDHAMLSADLLFTEGLIDEYEVQLSNDNLALIELAIRQHNVFRLRENLTERELMFCNIIRDADKIDILRVNIETPLEDIYNVSAEDLRNSIVSEKVYNQFMEKSAVLRANKSTPVDHLVSHISLVFELVFDRSLKEVIGQGYLDKMLHFKSDNPITNRQFEDIRSFMNDYIKGCR